jgi:hypothetical protein
MIVQSRELVNQDSEGKCLFGQGLPLLPEKALPFGILPFKSRFVLWDGFATDQKPRALSRCAVFENSEFRPCGLHSAQLRTYD